MGEESPTAWCHFLLDDIKPQAAMPSTYLDLYVSVVCASLMWAELLPHCQEGTQSPSWVEKGCWVPWSHSWTETSHNHIYLHQVWQKQQVKPISPKSAFSVMSSNENIRIHSFTSKFPFSRQRPFSQTRLLLSYTRLVTLQRSTPLIVCLDILSHSVISMLSLYQVQ